MDTIQYVLSGTTVLIFFSVALVGYQQFRLHKAKFKLDLFEKRYSVYKASQEFLSLILRDAKYELDDLFGFRAATQDAVFLFNDDIQIFLEALDTKALELRQRQKELENIPRG